MRAFLFGLALLCFASPVWAASAKPSFTFDDAFIRETPTKISAAYVTIANPRGGDDALQSASAEWAGKIQLHDVQINESGVLKMLPIKEVPLAKGGTIRFSPGGKHLMLYDIKTPLKAGQKRDIVLHFAKAGDIRVPFTVRPIAYRGKTKTGKEPSVRMDGMEMH